MKDFTITNTNHRNLDGLRAIGILMVMVRHFYGGFFNCNLLWTSIDLLFALSGLLITGILIETKEDPKYFQKFYMRRVLRIFPLYYLLILFFTFFIYCVSNHPEAFKYYSIHWAYFYTYTQNWCYIINGIPAEGHLNHTWSLAVDEQIYLLWPLLIWLCKTRKQLVVLCAGTICFSLLFRIGYNIYINYNPSLNPIAYFHNSLCRIDSFAAGSLLYCLLRYNSSSLNKRNMLRLFWLSLLLIISFAILDKSADHTGYFMKNFGITLAGLHFTTWLYFGVNNSGKILNYIFSNSLLVYIGKISYSLYVFHWFLIILIVPKIKLLLYQYCNINSLFLAYTLCFLITFLLSILSYTYFEKPIIRLKRKFSYKL